MTENNPKNLLDYRSPSDELKGHDAPLIIYFAGSFIGAAAATFAWVIVYSMEPAPPGPRDEMGLGVVVPFILMMGFIAIASLVASCIFRISCGKAVHRTTRFIRILGIINGFLGMGFLYACIFLEDFAHLGKTRTVWHFVAVANLVMPVIMGVVARRK